MRLASEAITNSRRTRHKSTGPRGRPSRIVVPAATYAVVFAGTASPRPARALRALSRGPRRGRPSKRIKVLVSSWTRRCRLVLETECNVRHAHRAAGTNHRYESGVGVGVK